MLSNYGCVISYRHQAAYHFDNTTVTSNNRSYLCNGNERHLSDCSTVLSDQCSQNTGVYIHCQGETKFTSFFSPSLFYAVVDVVCCCFVSPKNSVLIRLFSNFLCVLITSSGARVVFIVCCCVYSVEPTLQTWFLMRRKF